jgi:hypothetical protein
MWIQETVYTMRENSVASDLIIKALDDNGLSYNIIKDPIFGFMYIQSIGGLAERDNGPDSGWMVSIAIGESQHDLLPVGIGEYEPADGDFILVRYVDDHNVLWGANWSFVMPDWWLEG